MLRKGYILVVALMVVFIVSLLVASWFTYLQRRINRVDDLQNRVQAFYNAESGLAKAVSYLENNGAIPFKIDPSGVKTRIDTLFGDVNCIAEISIRERGFYTWITSIGKQGKVSETVSAYLGSCGQRVFTNACNISSPGLLYVSGKIIGDVETRGSVAGNVNGEIRHNPSLVFPVVNTSTITTRMIECRSLIENPAKADTEIFGPLIIDEETDLPPKRLIYVNDVVLVEPQDLEIPFSIEGNSIIVSPNEIQLSGHARISGIDFIAYDKILVTNSCILKNALLYSENGVEIRENAQFEGTILSKGEISVCEKARIVGNSAIVSNSDDYQIKLCDETKLCCSIILCPEVGLGKMVSSFIDVENDVQIKGLIFTTTGLRLRGSLVGSIYAPQFIGEPIFPDTQNLNVLEGEIIGLKEGSAILPLLFDELPRALSGWSRN